MRSESGDFFIAEYKQTSRYDRAVFVGVWLCCFSTEKYTTVVPANHRQIKFTLESHIVYGQDNSAFPCEKSRAKSTEEDNRLDPLVISKAILLEAELSVVDVLHLQNFPLFYNNNKNLLLNHGKRLAKQCFNQLPSYLDYSKSLLR